MKTAKRVLEYIKNYRIYIVISLLTALISVAGTLYIPVLAGDAIDLIAQRNFGGIGKILTAAAIVTAISALATWIMNICNNRLTYSVARDLRRDIFLKLGRLPVSYTDTKKTGETVSLATADTETVADGLLMGFTQFFTGVLTILGTLGFMLAINAKIAAAVVILTPLSLFVSKFIASKTYNMFRKQSEVRAQQTGLIDEYITNYKIIKAFNAEEKVIGKFDKVNYELKGYSFKAMFFSSLTNPSTRFINAVVYASVALIGALSVIGGGGLTVGGLTCLLSYANQYTKPFNEISGVVTELQGAVASAARVFELLDETEESNETAELAPAEGNIEFKDVKFSYIPERPLIDSFNLSVKKGQTIAIVGPTGCGKTTLINLIMRFYDVCSGSISVDGTDIKTVSRESLRRNFGMVLQDTWLKSGTIKDNIKMAKPDATDDEIINAAKASHAHSFIKRMENGYDTYIGEDGGGLSAGQRQLLCITRVMLLNPNILILDEATSSIDTHTEVRIQKAFDRLTNGRTAFIVAHRLSTIQNADVILVMKDGHIIEQGKHEELLEKGGFYHKLYMSRIA
ncbi:MAG: ABC transporter ATP-binding protein [Clostridia bacterium]|nr:ABC transporter ATP-binding protein [Clostridia bacterium]